MTESIRDTRNPCIRSAVGVTLYSVLRIIRLVGNFLVCKESFARPYPDTVRCRAGSGVIAPRSPPHSTTLYPSGNTPLGETLVVRQRHVVSAN